MPQSLSQTIIHVVFSTKNRVNWIDTKIRNELHAYIAGLLRKHDSQAFRVGGIADHIHIACTLPRTMTQSDLVKLVKHASSDWMRKQSSDYNDFYWQRGYAIFSVSYSNLETVVNYIDKQEVHHENISFQDELRLFMKKSNMSFDEKYIWD